MTVSLRLWRLQCRQKPPFWGANGSGTIQHGRSTASPAWPGRGGPESQLGHGKAALLSPSVRRHLQQKVKVPRGPGRPTHREKSPSLVPDWSFYANEGSQSSQSDCCKGTGMS